jgi:hypothetical protein
LVSRSVWDRETAGSNPAVHAISFSTPPIFRKEKNMQYNAERGPTLRVVTVARTPKPGDTVVLPAGLLYTNEYFAERRVTQSPLNVNVTNRCRDEFYWRDQRGHSCYTRFVLPQRVVMAQAHSVAATDAEK